MAGITCAAGAGAALIGLGYVLTGSGAAIDFVLLLGGLLLAAAGLFRLIKRGPPA